MAICGQHLTKYSFPPSFAAFSPAKRKRNPHLYAGGRVRARSRDVAEIDKWNRHDNPVPEVKLYTTPASDCGHVATDTTFPVHFIVLTFFSLWFVLFFVPDVLHASCWKKQNKQTTNKQENNNNSNIEYEIQCGLASHTLQTMHASLCHYYFAQFFFSFRRLTS
jgi:hypothetical protein